MTTISPHEVKIYCTFTRSPRTWFTSDEVAKSGISGVKFRCFHSGVQPPQIKEAPRTDMRYGVQTFI
jgi:hypothetical protein